MSSNSKALLSLSFSFLFTLVFLGPTHHFFCSFFSCSTYQLDDHYHQRCQNLLTLLQLALLRYLQDLHHCLVSLLHTSSILLKSSMISFTTSEHFLMDPLVLVLKQMCFLSFTVGSLVPFISYFVFHECFKF